MMKTKPVILLMLAASLWISPLFTHAQDAPAEKSKKDDIHLKGDPDAKAAEWVASLNLNDKAKEQRVQQLISTHLKAVRDWHNDHPYTLVPEGMNPITGKVFNKLERQVIINSTLPKTVHEQLMAGLQKELTSQQIEAILDKYTIGKVAFTFNGYKTIVPNLTPADENIILTNLKAAREQAIDYKNMDQISTIFKIYKTKIETYFTDSGRNWHQMFKAYADASKAKKGGAKEMD
jgi:hypothetical protein